MLNIVQYFVFNELLAEDQKERLRDQHARWIQSLVKKIVREETPMQRTSAINQHYEDIMAAVDWSVRKGKDREIGLLLAGNMGVYWYDRGQFREAVTWL